MTQAKRKDGFMLGRTAVALAAATVILALAILGVHGAVPVTDTADKPRADIIRIDGLKQFGGLERPAVVYLHEKHTQALAKKGKDCAACHPMDAKYLSARFMRVKDESRQVVMELYHNHCMGCHRETAAAGEKAGPVVCAGCHQDKTVPSSWKAIGMDKSLHYRHVKAQDKKCEVCHHEADPVSKKLVYAKGKEGSCRYCHLEKAVENVSAMRSASHQQCLDCHRKRLAQNQDAGPATCSGCHDAAVQKKIAPVKDLPRLERGQPNAALIQAVKRDGEKVDPFTRPAVVAFNHAGHESTADNCRVCHHASLEACGKCHTLQGSKAGKLVSLQTAMHRPGTRTSCLGCHESLKAEKRCAGCHATMPRKDAADVAGCGSCHVTPPTGQTAQALEPKAAAAALIEARKPAAAAYAVEDIPETVTIKALSSQYEPAKLPHRKIVQTLTANMKDSRLAAHFHRDPGTVCQGCHHNSPVAKKPPACASCHGQPFDSRNLFKPGLQAAYHLQCMECHKDMGIEKPAATNCTGCHKEKV